MKWLGNQMLTGVPDEVFAGRLAEAEAQILKGAELLVPRLPTGKEDGNAGAPEPKKTETEWRTALSSRPQWECEASCVSFC